MPKRTTQGRRALRASALVAAGIALIALSGAFKGFQGSETVAAQPSQSLSESMMAVVLGQEELPQSSGELPEWFEEEFFSLSPYYDIAVNEDGTVIGFHSYEPAQATLNTVVATLELKGWSALASGLDSVRTLVKKEGRCTWALLWCEDVAGQSSVVIQTLPV